MFCTHCGTALAEGDAYCPRCGAQQQNATTPPR